jgi:hypothetical protein
MTNATLRVSLAGIALLGSLAVLLVPEAPLEAALTGVTYAGRPTPPPGPLLWKVRITFAGAIALAGISAALFLLPAKAWGERLLRDFQQVRSSWSTDWAWDARSTALLALWGALGLGLRVEHLADGINADEAYTWVYFASRTLVDIVSDYSQPNNHVLHTILLHLVAGSEVDATSLRIPAFVAGMFLIPAVYGLTSRLTGDSAAGLLAAGVVAVAPAFVEYSAAARGYSLQTVAIVASASAAVRIRAVNCRWSWAVFVIGLVAALYTLPTAVYSAGVIALWMLGSAPRDRRRALVRELAIAMLLVGVFAGLLYAPIIARQGLLAIVANGTTKPLPLAEVFPKTLLQWRVVLQCWAAGWPRSAVLLAGLALTVSVVVSSPSGRRPGLFAAGILLWSIPIAAVQRVAPWARQLNVLLIFILPGVAFGALEISRRWARTRRSRWAAELCCVTLVPVAVLAAAQLRSGPSWLGNPPGGPSETHHVCSLPVQPYTASAAYVLDRRLTSSTLVLAHPHSGLIPTLQFELVRRGHSARLVRSSSIARAALEPVSTIFFVTRSGPEGWDPHDPFAIPGGNPGLFRELFQEPKLLADFGKATVYEAHRRRAAAGS